MQDPATFLDSPTPPLVLETLLSMVDDLRALLLKQQAELQRLTQMYQQLMERTASQRIGQNGHIYQEGTVGPWWDPPITSSPKYISATPIATPIVQSETIDYEQIKKLFKQHQQDPTN